ncbi:cytochrome P450 [Xylariaceae sp. FL1272]|nr:cytochrome P450 [Xylariaceae sp. FL1272]
MPGLKGLLLVAVAGVLSHRLYFIAGEHHLRGPTYAKAWVAACALLITLVSSTNLVGTHDNVSISIVLGAFNTVVVINAFYFGSLFTSIVLYRLFEHSLKRFPGPVLAATTKFYHTWNQLFLSNHIFLENICRKYGAIVRTGPQELTITDPSVFDAISGPGTSCIKSPFYDAIHPYVGLLNIRTKEAYAPRRKQWDDILGVKSSGASPDVSGKEIRIQHFATQLLRVIARSGDRPVNVTTWYNHFAFDYIGELAFGESFGLTDDPETSSATNGLAEVPKLLSEGMIMWKYFMGLPWLVCLVAKYAPIVPIVNKKFNASRGWAASVVDLRLAKYASDKDETDIEIELARQRDIQDKLREEIIASGAVRRLSNDDVACSKLNVAALSASPFLNGCINEALRLYPAVPTGGARETTDKHIKIGETVIPPHTVIIAPRWTIGRLESAFERATEYIPERWVSKPEMVKDRRAMNAFSIGRHTCPGQQIAMTEIRIVLAMLLIQFELKFAARREAQDKFADSFTDAFTAQVGDLDLIFTPIR